MLKPDFISEPPVVIVLYEGERLDPNFGGGPAGLTGLSLLVFKDDFNRCCILPGFGDVAPVRLMFFAFRTEWTCSSRTVNSSGAS